MSYYFNPHGHQCPWYAYTELLGYPSSSRCEEIACYLMSEPVNTVSSFAFLIVAFICSSFLLKKDHPDLKLFVNIFVLAAIFTAGFHLMNNFIMQLLAHGSFFILIMIGLVKSFIRWGKISYTERTPILLTSGFVYLLLSFLLYKKFAHPEILVPLIFTLYILLELKIKKTNDENENTGTCFLSYFLFLLGSLAIYLDQQKFNCDPQSYFQLHAFGHILLAFAFGLFFYHLYQFYPYKEIKADIDFDHLPAQDQETIEEINQAEEDFVQISLAEDELEQDENPEDDVQIEFSFDPDEDKDKPEK